MIKDGDQLVIKFVVSYSYFIWLLFSSSNQGILAPPVIWIPLFGPWSCHWIFFPPPPFFLGIIHYLWKFLIVTMWEKIFKHWMSLLITLTSTIKPQNSITFCQFFLSWSWKICLSQAIKGGWVNLNNTMDVL